MTRIPLLLALLLVLQKSLAQGNVVISGKVSNPLADEITLVRHPDPLLPGEQEIQAPLRDDGTFALQVPVQAALVAELLHGDEVVPIYLEPGFSLELSVNGEKFLRTLHYSGKGANENNYLAQYTYRFDEEEDYQVLPDNIKLKEKEFTAFLDYRKQDQLKNLEKYTAKAPVSSTFKAYASAEIAFSYANDKINYEPLREKILMTERLLKPSAEFYSFLETLNMNAPANGLSTSFRAFLQPYVAHYTRLAGVGEGAKQYYKASYDVAAQRLQGTARTLAQTHVLRQSIMEGTLQYTQQILEQFMASQPGKSLESYFSELYNQNKQFAIGSAAPDFKLKDINGDSLSLHDFKGHLVYINFWQVSCGLCMVDLPHLQNLTASMEGANVVFLNIGLDEDESVWRRVVAGRHLNGVQLYLRGMDSELARRYNLKEVPAYFLLDEKGNILSVKPRRPNDKEVINYLRQYLSPEHALAN